MSATLRGLVRSHFLPRCATAWHKQCKLTGSTVCHCFAEAVQGRRLRYTASAKQWHKLHRRFVPIAAPRRRIFSTQLTHGVARTFHAVGRAVLESASPGFQPGATPSQLPTQQNQQKKPDVVMTPGFRYSLESARPGVRCAVDRLGIDSPTHRRSYPSIHIDLDLAVLKSSYSLVQNRPAPLRTFD